SRAGLDQAHLFRAAAVAHYSGDHDCTVNSDYAAPRMAGEIRQTPTDRAVDAAAVVLCLRDRRDRLPDGLSDLRGEEQLTLFDICRAKSRENCGELSCRKPGGTSPPVSEERTA